MKRCEQEWTASRAEGVQALVRELCGFCPCEAGIPCPLFAPRENRADMMERQAGYMAALDSPDPMRESA